MWGKGKTHLIQRIGSKTTDIKHFIDLLPMDVKTVVEAFGGSFAVIRDVYYEDKYKKYVNDTDESLYYIYTHPDKLIEAYHIWNKIDDKYDNAKDKKEAVHKSKMDEHLKDYIINSMIVRGVITHKKNVENFEKDIELIKKIKFSNEDAFEFLKKFIYKKDTFIFLDPPYLFSNNESYGTQKQNEDNTDYYHRLLDIFNDKKVKAKIMLVINDLKILRIMFDKFIKRDYERTYQIGKKKMKHLVICNY